MKKITLLMYSKGTDIKLFGTCTSFVFVVITILFFYSCNEIVTGDCGVEPDMTKPVTFNLMNKTMSLELNFTKVEDNGTYRESINHYKTNEKLFQFIKNYCIGKNMVFDPQPMAFILYYDSFVSNNFTVTDDNIKGISVFSVNRNKITHSLYLRNEHNDFYEEKNVKVRVPGVSINHIVFYLKNYVFADNNNKSYIIISGDLATDPYKNPKKYWTSMQYEVEKRYQEKIQNTTRVAGCGPNECQSGTPKMICENTMFGPRCNSSGCLAERMFAIAEIQWSPVFNPDLMYKFRDEVLTKYENKLHFIYYYDYLGDEWADKITFDLAVETAKVLKDFNPVMSAFLEPDKHMDEIMFTSELTSSILNLLDNFQKITDSSEGVKILDSIREDVKMLDNRTLKEILQMVD